MPSSPLWAEVGVMQAHIHTETHTHRHMQTHADQYPTPNFLLSEVKVVVLFPCPPAPRAPLSPEK